MPEVAINKLELGCGQNQTPGYLHNDINPFDGVDIVGNPWEIDLPDHSMKEIIALGLMEHLTYEQFGLTLNKVRRLLEPGGIFLFDVPDIPVWCRYVVDHFEGRQIPFSIDHVFCTLYGWQRWPGDEHKSGWYREKLDKALNDAGFSETEYGLQPFKDRNISRRRMSRPHDAHLYCQTRA